METLKAWHVSIWNPGEMLSFSVNITNIRICLLIHHILRM